MKDYYSILGVEKNASEADIKKAFHQLSLKWHPDKWANATDSEKKDAEEKFKEIAEAYGVLSDKDKRQQYDMFGTTDGSVNFNMGDDDLSDMFKHFAGFGGLGGGFRQERENLNARFTLTVGVDDLYYGREKKFKYYRSAKCHVCDGKGTTSDGGIQKCQYCHGTGFITNTVHRGNTILQSSTPCAHCGGVGKIIIDPCNLCGGSGHERIEDEFTIKIPAGVMNGMRMLIPGRGNFASDGSGRCGDLELTFNVIPTGKFVQNGQYDLYTEIDVPVIDCITGSKTQITFLDGSLKDIEIPMRSVHGDVITVDGLGLPSKFGARGKLYVNINQIMPVKMETDEVEKLKELRTHKNFSI